MKTKRSYTREEILDGSKIGWEFEFYSNLPLEETARSIASYVGKRVVIPLALSNLKEPRPLYHSPVNPSSEIFKLEPDYSGGKKMCELVTGPMKFKDARNVLIKVFEWISSNGYTNDRCSIHANISFDKMRVPTLVNIPQLNIAKFILDFDEKRVYDVFPDRENSVYARSIKTMYANRVMFYSPSLEEFNRSTLTLPADEKYYGVNFLKAEKGYLEFRYMGGENYHKKTRKILDLIDYYLIYLYETLNFNGVYSDTDRTKFKKFIKDQEDIYKSFIKYGEFKQRFPNVKVFYDMIGDDQTLQSVWGNLRDKLFDLIVTGDLRKGEFNFDTEAGRFQLKDTKISNCRVSDVEFINCEISGVIDRSWFYDCKITNSRVSFSYATKGNTFDSCKVSETPLHITNTCNNCFIENKKHTINCEVNGGVIRNGEIGKLAKVSPETMIVEQIEPVETPGNYKNVEDGAKKKDKEKKDAK
jgi:hypothetical protein